jgi:signal transduction histidine kinase
VAIALPVAALSIFQITYRSSTFHIAFEAIAGFIALFAAFLLIGRVTYRKLLSDVVLVVALAIFAITNITRAVAPEIIGSGWFLTTSGFLVATTFFAGAAWLPERQLGRPGRGASTVGATAVSTVPLVALLLRTLDPFLPSRTAAEVVMAGLFTLACAGFYRRAFRGSDDLLRWLASGSALAALARVNYAVPPYPEPGQFSTGDMLRMGFYVSLMIGAAIEIVAYWKKQSRLAVLEERRRIARELHDGLAQDLFFIRARSSAYARSNELIGMNEVAEAAARALTESRRAITTLSSDEREPLDVALSDEAENVAKRFDLRLILRVEPGVRASTDSKTALLRIAREAITNAGRHGQASRVSLRLSNGTNLRLRVEDDGIGFDPGETEAGFGLFSMQERARSLGGDLSITSRVGEGTIVEAEIP